MEPTKSRIGHLVLLAVLATGIGIYLIGTTIIIAKDSIGFIEYARSLQSNPTEAMLKNYQHPGYPLLVLAGHQIVDFLGKGTSVFGWVYCAQSVSLLFRVLALVALYLVGIRLVGEQRSFVAVLILLFLPEPARLGSDALSDWPALFFLAAGFLLLLGGTGEGKWWLFGFAGMVSGAGYLVRPECVQLVVCGAVWLGLQLVRPSRAMPRSKAVTALLMLVVGFAIVAWPYMRLKGAVFPKKQVGRFTSSAGPCDSTNQTHHREPAARYLAGCALAKLVGAVGKLIQRVCETLMWFFVPALVLGLYDWYGKRKRFEPGHFLVAVLVGLNVALMVWLYCNYGYMSRRHVLPMVIFAMFFIPAGLESIARWLSVNISKCGADKSQQWLVILLVVGICICIPKLVKPIRSDKKNYLQMSRWLAENTAEDAVVAVFDKRISFYAGRKGVKYEAENVPKEADYLVKIISRQSEPGGQQGPAESTVLFTTPAGGRGTLAVYKLKDSSEYGR